MKDFTLSPVFNIRGRNEIKAHDSNYGVEPIVGDNGQRKFIPIDKFHFSINNSDNCKGVGRIKSLVSQI
jgi:hypothetical protein